MSKIEQLIQELCPGGVPTKKVEQLGSFFSGLTGKSKDDFKEGNAKFITYKNIFSNPSLNLDFNDKVKVEDGEKQNVVVYGDVLFTGSSETPDECGMSSVVTEHPNEAMYLNSFCFGWRLEDKSIYLPQFLKHLLRCQSIRNQIAKTANGVTRYNVSKKLFGKIQIPLPPLPIQEEIVRILDTFTEAQANLEQELELRKKQYEYYRNQLLYSESGNYLSVSEFCELKAGKAIKASELSETKSESHIYPCFGGNGIRGYIQKKSHSGDYAIIGRQGALCGCVNWAMNDFYATEHAVVVSPKDTCISRFLYYLFTVADLNQYKSQGAQPGLAVSNLNELKYIIPSKERQQEIVSILDKFESAIQTLEEELALRKKQYEYYREKLLTYN